MGRVFANGPGDQGSMPGWVILKTQKWYIMPPCLTFSIIRYESRVKWSNRVKGVVLSPTPRCSSYWKGSLQVAFDYGRQLYFNFIYIYVYIYIYIYILIYNLPAFTVTKKKKKKPCQNSEITNLESLPGEKRKKLSGKKKKRPTSSHQLKKIKRYAISWSKEQDPTAKCCNATITKSAQYEIEPITKIKSQVGTILLQFLKRLLRVPSTD